MPNHLTTVEGTFDGKAILPLGRINKATLNKVKGLLRAFFAI